MEYNTPIGFGIGTEFNIESSRSVTGLLTYIDTENKKLKVTFFSSNDFATSYDEHIFTKPGGTYIFFLPTDTINTLNITSADGEELKDGSIWIQPLDLELYSDFSYEIIVDYPIQADKDYESLNYSIWIYEDYITARFTYEKRYKENGVEINDLANPYSVCQGNFCLDNIDSFTFARENLYTIKLKFEKRIIKVDGEDKVKYFLPAFTFYAIDPPILKYGVNTFFKKKNNIFKFEYSGKSTGFLTYVNAENKNLNITYISKKSSITITNYESHVFKYPGGGCIFYVNKNYYNILHIDSMGEPLNREGAIWIFPLNNDINIDLMHGINNSYTVMYDEDPGTLTYSASYVKAASKYLVFNYVKEYKDEDIQVKDLKNPFRICNLEMCEDNVDKYEIVDWK